MRDLHDRPTGVSGGHDTSVYADQIVGDQRLQQFQFFAEIHIRSGDVEIYPKLAHQAFDAGALPLGGIQTTTARRRQMAIRNRANIARNIRNVLDIPTRESGNGRRSEAEERLSPIVGISLD